MFGFGCAIQNVFAVDQIEENIEKSTIQWYESQTEKEEFFLKIMGYSGEMKVLFMKWR